jgi:caa(3)-type oxidase subunit IV
MTTPSTHTTHNAPNEGTYFAIFVLLAVLTVIELLVVYIPGLKVPLLLGLACTKAWLVIRYFMNLKYDTPIFTWTFLLPVAIGALITLGLPLFLQ